MEHGIGRVLGAVSSLFATAGGAVAGPMNRLQSVSKHAQEKASGGPEHLWLGVAIFSALAVVIGLAAWWTLKNKKP